MANGDRVATEERVVRYAKPTAVEGDVVNGTAFDRRPTDVTGLSVSRLGIFDPDRARDLAMLRTVIGSALTLSPNGRLAEIGVGTIEAVGREVGQLLHVAENALPAVTPALANPAHALIDGLPFKGAPVASLQNETAGDLLALRVSELHDAL